MRRKGIFLSTFISTALLLVSCGGGGGSGAPSGPFLAWAKFRRNNNNSGVASSSLNRNKGEASLIFPLSASMAATASTPALAGNDVIYLGTSNGLLSITTDGEERWHLTTCNAPGAIRPLGRVVASPTVGPNDEDILVGTEGTDGTNGGIFRIVDDNNSGVPQCRWGFPSNGVAFATRSSPPVIADPNDFALLTFFVGTSAGRLIALASDGSRRWSFPEDAPLPGNLSSSPAFSTLGIVLSAPDGRVYTLDETGRQLWAFRTGLPPAGETEIQASVATQDSVFAVNRRSLFSLNIDGSERWRYETPDEVLGSPAASFLVIPRDSGQLVQESVVHVVDRSGTLVAIVNSTGEPVRLCSLDNETCSPSSCPGETECLDVGRRCSETEDRECDDDGDCPDGEDCESTGRCKDDESIECTEDTCNDDDGLCTRRAVLPLTRSAEISVESSPAISLDAYIVAATTDGRVCARSVDGSVPGGQCEQSGSNCTPDSCGAGDQCCGEDDQSCPVPGHCRNEPSLACTMDSCSSGDICKSPWHDGCIQLPTELGTTTQSSPIVDADGRIYVTTERGLVRIE